MTAFPSMQSLVQTYLESGAVRDSRWKFQASSWWDLHAFQISGVIAVPSLNNSSWIWFRAVPDGQPHSPGRRLQTIRPFARFCLRLDPATYIPEQSIFGRAKRRLTPHIYTDCEITDLLRAAGQLKPEGTLRPATYKTLLGLIAATGLRISEALKLRFVDLDFARGVLTVRQTKFTKSRLVPLHPSVTSALSCYAVVRQRAIPTEPKSFFCWLIGNCTAQIDCASRVPTVAKGAGMEGSRLSPLSSHS